MATLTRICADQDAIKKLILQNNNFDIVLKAATLFDFSMSGFVYPVTAYEFISDTLTYNQTLTLFENIHLTKQVRGVIIKIDYPLQDDKTNVPIEKQYLQMEVFEYLQNSPSTNVTQKINNLYINLMPSVDDGLLTNIGLIDSIVLTNTHQENYSINVSALLIK